MASGEGARLTMELDEGELRPYLKEMARRGKDLRPYFKRLGTHMAFRSIPKTFEQQGRSPKWKKLGDYTLAIRKWRATSPKVSPHRVYHEQVLIQSRELMEHNTFVARPKRLDVGTVHAHGADHQFGRTVRAPRRWKTVTHIKLKTRRWLGIWPEDEKIAVKFAIRYLDKG